MGRMYEMNASTAVTTVLDIFEINAPADACVVIHGIFIGQSTDAGDVESEQLLVRLHRGSTSGSGGSAAANLNPLQAGDPAFGGTGESWNTTQSTLGAVLHIEAFNIMAGLALWWTPETRPVISPSGRLVLDLITAPIDSISIAYAVIFEEIGG